MLCRRKGQSHAGMTIHLREESRAWEEDDLSVTTPKGRKLRHTFWRYRAQSKTSSARRSSLSSARAQCSRDTAPYSVPTNIVSFVLISCDNNRHTRQVVFVSRSPASLPQLISIRSALFRRFSQNRHALTQSHRHARTHAHTQTPAPDPLSRRGPCLFYLSRTSL